MAGKMAFVVCIGLLADLLPAIAGYHPNPYTLRRQSMPTRDIPHDSTSLDIDGHSSKRPSLQLPHPLSNFKIQPNMLRKENVVKLRNPNGFYGNVREHEPIQKQLRAYIPQRADKTRGLRGGLKKPVSKLGGKFDARRLALEAVSARSRQLGNKFYPGNPRPPLSKLERNNTSSQSSGKNLNTNATLNLIKRKNRLSPRIALNLNKEGKYGSMSPNIKLKENIKTTGKVSNTLKASLREKPLESGLNVQLVKPSLNTTSRDFNETDQSENYRRRKLNNRPAFGGSDQTTATPNASKLKLNKDKSRKKSKIKKQLKSKIKSKPERQRNAKKFKKQHTKKLTNNHHSFNLHAKNITKSPTSTMPAIREENYSAGNNIMQSYTTDHAFENKDRNRATEFENRFSALPQNIHERPSTRTAPTNLLTTDSTTTFKISKATGKPHKVAKPVHNTPKPSKKPDLPIETRRQLKNNLNALIEVYGKACSHGTDTLECQVIKDNISELELKIPDPGIPELQKLYEKYCNPVRAGAAKMCEDIHASQRQPKNEATPAPSVPFFQDLYKKLKCQSGRPNSITCETIREKMNEEARPDPAQAFKMVIYKYCDPVVLGLKNVCRDLMAKARPFLTQYID